MIAFSLLDLIVFGSLLAFFASVLFLSRAGYDLAPSNPKALRATRQVAAARQTTAGGSAGDRSVAGGRRRLAVCAGDSITRGSVSSDYVSILQARLPDWDFSNAGVNGELAYNLVERLDDIVALDPDAVTVLIGTNDVNATFGFRAAIGYIAVKQLPEVPSQLFFRENLISIVRTLKRETRAKVALFSIPPIGEEPGHYAYLRTEDYAAVIKAVADEEGVAYLPLRERICAFIEGLPREAQRPLGFRYFGAAQLRVMSQQRFLGKSLDEISASNRFHFLVDGIHLNTHGAALAAELAESFLRSL
jgi:acyl-CoA thioesterase I